MESRLFTLGYAQWSIEEEAACADKHDAVLIDVRHAPHTTKPGFSKGKRMERLGPRYQHVLGFGNINYESGPVELAAPEEGRSTVQAFEKPIILMCGCPSVTECHRSTVADILSSQMSSAPIHLRAPPARNQPDLFEGASN